MEIIGLIPAGGSAKRLGQIPCSKEIFPVGFAGKGGERRPKAVSQYLLDKYRAAECDKVYFILRQGKWDIPAYYGDGQHLDLEIAYLMLRHLYGVPYTLDRAYPYVREATVLLGFPDMIYEPEDAFTRLMAYKHETRADVVISLYDIENTYEASKSDMVVWNPVNGDILDFEIKPSRTELRQCWVNAVWGPAFTAFLHTFIQEDLPQRIAKPEMAEIHVSEIILAAKKSGLNIKGLPMPGCQFLDVGTLVSMEKGWQRSMDKSQTETL